MHGHSAEAAGDHYEVALGTIRFFHEVMLDSVTYYPDAKGIRRLRMDAADAPFSFNRTVSGTESTILD